MKKTVFFEWLFCILAIAALVLLFAGFLLGLKTLIFIGFGVSAVVIAAVMLLATFTDIFFDQPHKDWNLSLKRRIL